jgi:hypothetical protein
MMKIVQLARERMEDLGKGSKTMPDEKEQKQ